MNDNRITVKGVQARRFRKHLRKKREKKLEPGQKAGFTVVDEANPDWLKAFNSESATLGPLSKPILNLPSDGE